MADDDNRTLPRRPYDGFGQAGERASPQLFGLKLIEILRTQEILLQLHDRNRVGACAIPVARRLVYVDLAAEPFQQHIRPSDRGGDASALIHENLRRLYGVTSNRQREALAG